MERDDRLVCPFPEAWSTDSIRSNLYVSAQHMNTQPPADCRNAILPVGTEGSLFTSGKQLVRCFSEACSIDSLRSNRYVTAQHMNTPTPADCWKLLLDDPSNAPVGDEKMVLVMPSSYQYPLMVLEILPLPTPGPHYKVIRAVAEGMRLLLNFFRSGRECTAVLLVRYATRVQSVTDTKIIDCKYAFKSITYFP